MSEKRKRCEGSGEKAATKHGEIGFYCPVCDKQLDRQSKRQGYHMDYSQGAGAIAGEHYRNV